MPNIYLKHPVHGHKVAIMDEEAEYDEHNGWTRYNIDTPTPKVEAAAPVSEEPVVNTLQTKTRRKSA